MMEGSHHTTVASQCFDLKRQEMLLEWRRLLATGASTADLMAEVQSTHGAMLGLLKQARAEP